jgi:hypothetical protein
VGFLRSDCRGQGVVGAVDAIDLECAVIEEDLAHVCTVVSAAQFEGIADALLTCLMIVLEE